MTIFPNAKVNIGLRIVSERKDGFHNIETILYPVPLKDAIEFVTSDGGNDSDSLTSTGIITGCPMNENLAVRAVNLIRRTYNIPPLQIHLHKAIPAGAGLGGGSSDAAFMLRYLNRYFRLGLCNNDLKRLALELGSDCPFFIDNRPLFAEGRGELFSPLKPLLGGYYIMIVNPGIEVKTSEAYSKVVSSRPGTDLRDLYYLPPAEWKEYILNDFENVVFRMHPEIGDIKANLYRMGAQFALMSGSGSSVFGLFESKPADYSSNLNYFTWSGIL